MTSLRPAAPSSLVRAAPAADSVRSPERPSASSSETTVARFDGVDRFVRATPPPEPLVAGNAAGVAAAFILNGMAIWAGVSDSMTGIPRPPALPRIAPVTTELVVRRGLSGV